MTKMCKAVKIPEGRNTAASSKLEEIHNYRKRDGEEKEAHNMCVCIWEGENIDLDSRVSQQLPMFGGVKGVSNDALANVYFIINSPQPNRPLSFSVPWVFFLG